MLLTTVITKTGTVTPEYSKSDPSYPEPTLLCAQSCPTLCSPMDCSPPGSSVHGIFQATILAWVAIPFSRGSSWSRDRTRLSCTAGRFFTTKSLGKPQVHTGNNWRERREGEGERDGLWLSLLPPLEQRSESESGRTFLYISLALYVLSTLQSY